MTEPKFEANHDNILTDAEGRAFAPFVDSCVTQITEYQQGDVMLLRLYDSATAGPGDHVPASRASQVRMSARTARRLAATLVAQADAMEGVGQTRQ